MDSQLLQINGYNLIRLDRAWTSKNQIYLKQGGGVGMYIKDSYSYSTNTFKRYNTSCNHMESVWVEISRANAKNIIIGTLHRPQMEI